MSESFVEVNGIKICYEIKGEGEPLFLVHGFGAKKEVWVGQFEPLSKHFKVIRFDNRGAGKSDRPNQPYTMEMFADDLAGLMDALNIPKAHIVGWSLGGMIVQKFLILYPEKVKKAVLINTLPSWPADKSGLEMYKNSQIESYHARLKDPVGTFFEKAKMGFSRQFLKMMREDPKKVFHGLFSAEDLIKESTINPSTPQDIINQTHALGNYNVLEDLSKVKTPTLIICADKDRQTPKVMNEKIHEKIPNSELVVIKGAGHDSPKERAPEINEHIIKFLKN
ncbi:MAG: alpha/beta fold hydrolase [Promethearchaeota archaeon]